MSAYTDILAILRARRSELNPDECFALCGRLEETGLLIMKSRAAAMRRQAAAQSETHSNIKIAVCNKDK